MCIIEKLKNMDTQIEEKKKILMYYSKLSSRHFEFSFVPSSSPCGKPYTENFYLLIHLLIIFYTSMYQ